MVIKAAAGRLGRAVRAVLLLSGAVLLMIFANQGKQGAYEGIELCLKTLVPSLFPFMVLSNLAVNTGVCAAFGRRLDRPFRAVFGLGGSLSAVFLLSMTGGYPVGAAAVSKLFEDGAVSEAEARKAALFCVGAGPAFLIGFVGSGIYGSPVLGAVLYSAQLISAVILGAAVNIFWKTEEKVPAEKPKPPLPFSQALTESVYAASRSTAVIIGFVILFCCLLSVSEQVIKNKAVGGLLSFTLEISSALSRPSAKLPVEAAAFAAGFGGICVHFQIFAQLGKIRLNKLLFFVIRIIHGAICALLTHIALILFPMEVQVFSSASQAHGGLYGGSAVSGAILAAVSLCFFICVKQQKQK